MVDFSEIIQKLVDIGFYDVFLPFILVYAVVFAILEKSKIFSGGEAERDNVRNVNSVIAFVFGLFVVASIQTVKYLQGLITNIVVLIIFILVVLILLAFLFGEDYTKILKGEDGKMKGAVTWTIATVVLAISVYVLFSVMGIWDGIVDWVNNNYDSELMATVVILGLVAGVIVWITKGSDKGGSSAGHDNHSSHDTKHDNHGGHH